MNIMNTIQSLVDPIIQRLLKLKILVITILILSTIVGVALALHLFEVYLGALLLTHQSLMLYLGLLDAILLMVLYVLISRQLSLSIQMVVYSAIIYGLLTISGTGLPWTSSLINTVILVVTPLTLTRFPNWKWAILGVFAGILTLNFVLSGALGPSIFLAILYYVPVVVLVALAFKAPLRLLSDAFVTVTLLFPVMMVSVFLFLSYPSGLFHQQTLQVEDTQFIIKQTSTSFIDQVYSLTVYESIGLGFYHPIYTYSQEWQLGLWTMQDARLIPIGDAYILTLVSPDESESFSVRIDPNNED